MRKTIFYLFLITIFYNCKDDDSRTCTTCSSEQTATFEVCRESSGNASVNGEDTNTDYDVYLAGLEDAGAVCGN